MKLFNIILTVFLFVGVLSGQQVEKATYQDVILKNGTLVTVTNGTMESDVLIKDGKIAAIGKDLSSEGATIIDIAGKYVYPGMIDAGTRMGLAEVGSVSLTQDYNEIGDFIPHMQAITAINPNSVNIPVNRVSGVTTTLSNPSGGLFPGTSALIHLHGYTPSQMYAGFKGVILNFPSTGKRGRWDRRSEEDIKKAEEKAFKKLNDTWKKAVDYARMDSIAAARNEKKLGYNPQMDALLPVIQGILPLLLEVNKESDIKAALKWIKDKNVRIILTGVAEGWRIAKEIAKANIPVIVGPVLDNPRRASDPYDINYKNPGILEKAGVLVAIRTKEAENVRNLPYNAGFAATYGMGTEKALAAITINPAKIFGLEKQIGSIEKDKIANLFVSTGDPFETKNEITHLFINGWNVPLESRHTLLYDEFLERDPGVSK